MLTNECYYPYIQRIYVTKQANSGKKCHILDICANLSNFVKYIKLQNGKKEKT